MGECVRPDPCDYQHCECFEGVDSEHGQCCSCGISSCDGHCACWENHNACCFHNTGLTTCILDARELEDDDET